MKMTYIMKRCSPFLLMFFLLGSCHYSSSDSEIETIKIDPTKSESIKRSELLDFQEIIRPSELKGGTYRIIPGDSCFLIVGNEMTLHDRSGRFLRSIGQNGNGPGEYLAVTDVVMQDNLIRVLDRTGHKIMDYNREGVFLKEYPINLFGQAMTLQDSNTLVYGGMERNENNSRLFLFNKNLSSFETALDYNENLSYLNVRDKTNFFLFNDSLRFLWAYDNNIYNADVHGREFTIIPRYRLDFGSYKIPEDFFQEPYANIMEFEMALMKTDYAGRVAGFYEDDHQLMFGFRFRQQYLLAIYNKQTGTTQVVDSFLDDVLFDGSTIPVAEEWFSMHFLDRQVYMVMDAWQAAERIKSLKQGMTPAEWKQTLENNPILAELNGSQDENAGPLIFVFEVRFKD